MGMNGIVTFIIFVHSFFNLLQLDFIIQQMNSLISDGNHDNNMLD